MGSTSNYEKNNAPIATNTLSKRMVCTAMESNGGGVVIVSVLLAGGVRSANRPENKYGLIAGSLKDTLRDNLPSRAITVPRNSIEL